MDYLDLLIHFNWLFIFLNDDMSPFSNLTLVSGDLIWEKARLPSDMRLLFDAKWLNLFCYFVIDITLYESYLLIFYYFREPSKFQI